MVINSADKEKKTSAVERVLAKSQRKKEGLITKEKKKEEVIKPKIRRTRKTKKKVHGDPENYKVQTRTDVKKKKEDFKAGKFEEDNFIPIEVWYYLKWKCPSCKKQNIQEFANVYNVYGPAWTGPGVICEKCKKHFNVAYEEFEEED